MDSIPVVIRRGYENSPNILDPSIELFLIPANITRSVSKHLHTKSA